MGAFLVGVLALLIAVFAWMLPQQPAESRADGRRIDVKIAPSSYDVASSRWQPYGPFYEAQGDLHSRYGVTHAHAYGNDNGRFVYRFDLEAGGRRDHQVELKARLSADAEGYSDPDGRYTDVTVVVNGEPLPVRRVMPDDGHGAHYTWQFDATALRRGGNTVEFVVGEDVLLPHGLAIYGHAIAPGHADEHITLIGG